MSQYDHAPRRAASGNDTNYPTWNSHPDALRNSQIPVTSNHSPQQKACITLQFPWTKDESSGKTLQMRLVVNDKETTEEFLYNFLMSKTPPVIWRQFQEHYKERFAVRVGPVYCFQMEGYREDVDPVYDVSLATMDSDGTMTDICFQESILKQINKNNAAFVVRVEASLEYCDYQGAPVLVLDDEQAAAKKASKKRKLRNQTAIEPDSAAKRVQKYASESVEEEEQEEEEEEEEEEERRESDFTDSMGAGQGSGKQADMVASDSQSSRVSFEVKDKFDPAGVSVSPNVGEIDWHDIGADDESLNSTSSSLSGVSNGSGTDKASEEDLESVCSVPTNRAQKKEKYDNDKDSSSSSVSCVSNGSGIDKATEEDLESVHSVPTNRVQKKEKLNDDKDSTSSSLSGVSIGSGIDKASEEDLESVHFVPTNRVKKKEKYNDNKDGMVATRKSGTLPGERTYDGPESVAESLPFNRDAMEAKSRATQVGDSQQSFLTADDEESIDDLESTVEVNKPGLMQEQISAEVMNDYLSTLETEGLNGQVVVESQSREALWEDRFSELVEFKQRVGHCWVPKHREENQALANWVNAQRKRYQKELLEEKKIEALNGLGFVWTCQRNHFNPKRDRGTLWQCNLQELAKYKERFGDCCVPRHWTENKALALWVKNLRLSYHNKSLEQGRIDALNDLGFDWSVQPRRPASKKKRESSSGEVSNARVEWEKRFQELVEFKDKHGHCNVPRRFSDNRLLGEWVQCQRRLHKTSWLLESRRDMLNNLGFQWQIRAQSHCPWEQRFQELVEFKNKHGHCRVPQDYKENKPLGGWVQRQRASDKKGCLQEGRRQALDQLGFTWSASKSHPAAANHEAHHRLPVPVATSSPLYTSF